MIQTSERVALPQRLERRPRRGDIPIPYTVLWVDGVPDFRINDVEAWLRCARGRLCSLCGERLASKIWFIGGPAAMNNHLFSDMAMHEECARYATSVCPYIALGRGYRPSRLSAGVVVHGNVSDQRPRLMFLGACYGYDLLGAPQAIRAGRCPPQVKAHTFKHVEQIGAVL